MLTNSIYSKKNLTTTVKVDESLTKCEKQNSKHRHDLTGVSCKKNISNGNQCHPNSPSYANTVVTYYKNITVSQDHTQIPLSQVIELICSEKLEQQTKRVRSAVGDKDLYKSLKSKLPAVSFSGLFSPGKSVSAANFVRSTGLIVIDLDHLADAHQAKANIVKNDCVAFAFISPGGSGLKVGIRVPANKILNKGDFTHVYYQIEALFFNWGYEADKACKDIRRACFLCHDCEIYFNPHASEYDLKPFEEKQKKESKKLSTKTQSYEPHNSENNLLQRCLDILYDSVDGTRHQARLRSGNLLGGFVAAGRLPEGALYDLERASDQISSTGTASYVERKTLKSAFENGKLAPVPLDEPQSKRPPQKKTIRIQELINGAVTTDSETLLKNLCGDITGYIVNNKAYILENKTGHYCLYGESRNWITMPEFAEQLHKKTNDTVYSCPRYIDAEVVASMIRHNGDEFNLYYPDIKPEWHRFAAKQGVAFIHTRDIKLSKKYQTSIKKSESTERLFYEHDSLNEDSRGGTFIAKGRVEQNYQNHLLGGDILPTAKDVLGKERLYFSTKYPRFYKHLEETALSEKQTNDVVYISSTVNTELNKQLSFSDKFPHVQLDSEILNVPGVYLLPQVEGSGKTGLIAELLNHYRKRFMAITNTESLTGELALRLGCTNYKNTTDITKGRHNNRVATCLNSIINPIIDGFSDRLDTVFFDEMLSILDGLACGEHIRERQRPLIEGKLIELLKSPVVFIADANLNQAALEFIKSVRSDIYIGNFSYKKYKKPEVVFYNTDANIIQRITDILPDATGCITLVTDSIKAARYAESALLKNTSLTAKDIALLHSENKGGDEYRDYSSEFWANIDGHLNQYKVLITSPVIGSGISLEQNIDNQAFCIFTNHLNIPAYLQQMARNRKATDLYIYFNENASYSGRMLSAEQAIKMYTAPTPLDIFYLTREVDNKNAASNKLELLMRSMERKGYSLSWSGVGTKINMNEAKKVVNEERLTAILNASNDAILNPKYRNRLTNNSHIRQVESDELTRFNLASLFIDSPDNFTREKLRVLPQASKVLRNREIRRTALPVLKKLDARDLSIISRKKHYVDKQYYLQILSKAEKPSNTICRNVVSNLITGGSRCQQFLTANIKYWEQKLDDETLNYQLVVSRLCDAELGFKIEVKKGEWNIIEPYNWSKVDKIRENNNFSLLSFDPQFDEKLVSFLRENE